MSLFVISLRHIITHRIMSLHNDEGLGLVHMVWSEIIKLIHLCMSIVLTHSCVSIKVIYSFIYSCVSIKSFIHLFM